MKQLLLKPAILVLLLIILPSVTITVFQLNSLNQQEEAFDEIYKRQLKSVIFSLNMYADDVVNQWVSKVSNYVQNDEENKDSLINSFINNYSHIKGFLLKEVTGEDKYIDYNRFGNISANENTEINELLYANSKVIDQLFSYLQNNYRKVQVFDLTRNSNENIFAFAIQVSDQQKYVGMLLIEAELLIVDILVPRIQSTAQSDMAIGVIQKEQNKLVYSNNKETTYEPEDINEVFWQLPDYSIYLKPLGNTTQSLVRERSRNSVFLLIIADLVLILGAVLIYLNVKKQMHLAKIKSDFVSNVSHEIRTPLSLISMYAESLQLNRVRSEEKLQKSYSIIFREANRLSGIVNNILNFSKIESGKRKFVFQSLSLNTSLNSILERYHLGTENQQVQFIKKLEDNIPNVWADRQAVEEVLANLIDNAIKYSKENKVVEISTGNTGEMNWIEVKDNGIGISREEQKLIFKQFYRVTDGNLAHHAKGSGLGLNIVKQIVEAHHGKIDVESEIGEGAVFRVFLPVVKIK